jgi:hypothetical protein
MTPPLQISKQRWSLIAPQVHQDTMMAVLMMMPEQPKWATKKPRNDALLRYSNGH